MPHKNMNVIPTMPNILGQQFYPLGFPIHHTQLTYNGQPLHEILFQQEPSQLQEQVRKDYYLYWLYAPIWNISQEDKNSAIQCNSIELLTLLLDNGIDPI